jgi:dTDP-4-dehydrorhamnose reductase
MPTGWPTCRAAATATGWPPTTARTMKILLLGKNGQVGWELQRALAPLGEVVACDFDSPATAGRLHAARIAGRRWCARAPGLIVNAAAHTAVDKAESEPIWRAPSTPPPGVLAREAAALGAWLVHYSTDYVFDGSGDQPRATKTRHRPAERLRPHQARRRAGDPRQRLPPPDPAHQLGLCGARRQLRAHHAAPGGRARRAAVIADQIGAPTGAELLADVTPMPCAQAMAQAGPGGTYHCVAGGETNWHGYACLSSNGHARTGQHPRGPRRHPPIPPATTRRRRARPLNSRLDTASCSGLRPATAALAAGRRAHAAEVLDR